MLKFENRPFETVEEMDEEWHVFKVEEVKEGEWGSNTDEVQEEDISDDYQPFKRLTKQLEEEKDPVSVLDLGCGLGPVGVVLKDQWDTQLTMIDVNQRAVDLAKENLKRYGLQADLCCQDGVQEGEYACIVFNPPIRAGKKVIYRLFQEAIEHLSQDGHLWIVMRKQHGAQSAIQYLEDLGCLVRKVKRDKGFWVFVAQKKSTGSYRV